jgi:methyl-accepting chemotaxis protein
MPWPTTATAPPQPGNRRRGPGRGHGHGAWIILSLRRQLGGEPDYAAHIVRQIADGNLGAPVSCAGDRSSLLYAMHTMRERLTEIMRSVTLSPSRWATLAPAQCHRTCAGQASSEQAAAVEEVHSAISMSLAIQQTGEHARRTDQIALAAAADADKSGAAVQSTVAAMRGIARQVVIDDIAYQTNLLALNAPSKRRAPANMDAASRWWRRKSASWPSAARAAPRDQRDCPAKRGIGRSDQSAPGRRHPARHSPSLAADQPDHAVLAHAGGRGAGNRLSRDAAQRHHPAQCGRLELATTAEVVAERARDWRPAVLLQTARDQAAGNPSLTGLNRP